MASKAKLGAGNVDITLDGKTETLRPTLRAAQALSRRSGGFSELVNEVAKFDLDAVTAVIAMGLDRKSQDIAEAVWRSGVAEMAGPVIEFIGILANGGRRPDQSAGGEEDADPQNA
jgi:hypothetical protein